MTQPPAFGLIPNRQKSKVLDYSRAIVGFGRRNGYQVLMPPEIAAALQHEEWACPTSQWQGRVHFAVTLGGDGTLLDAVKTLAPQRVPVLGLNFGRVGFLTEYEAGDWETGLQAALSGELQEESRMMVEATIRRGQEAKEHYLAFNDVVVTKGPFARLVHLEVHVNGALVGIYAADGLIVSSPTGSTAYSLSAGGPVVSPSVEALLITPICAHSLDSRTLVLDPDSAVSIVVQGDHTETFLTADGQVGAQLYPDDEVLLRTSHHRASLLRRKDFSFLRVLRQKLADGTF